MRRFCSGGLVATVLVGVALLTACGGSTEQDGGAGEEAPIKIGVNLEMSGPASVLGQAFVNATKLRARTLNKQEAGSWAAGSSLWCATTAPIRRRR